MCVCACVSSSCMWGEYSYLKKQLINSFQKNTERFEQNRFSILKEKQVDRRNFKDQTQNIGLETYSQRY